MLYPVKSRQELGQVMNLEGRQQLMQRPSRGAACRLAPYDLLGVLSGEPRIISHQGGPAHSGLGSPSLSLIRKTPSGLSTARSYGAIFFINDSSSRVVCVKLALK